MWNRFRAGLHWMKAETAYGRGEDGRALAHAEEFLRLDRRPKDYHFAFYALLLVLNKRSGDAEPVFRKVASGEVRRGWRVIDADYAKSYSAYYLALIEKDDGVTKHWSAARSRPQSSFARRFLPLPPVPIP